MTVTPYCSVADVQAVFLNLDISGTNKITDTEVDDYILEESAMFDSIIRYKYITPLTDPDALIIAKKAVRYLVAARVFSTLKRSSGATFKAEDVAFDKLAFETGKGILKKLEKDILILPEIELKEPRPKNFITKTFKFKTRDHDKNQEHVFQKNKLQW